MSKVLIVSRTRMNHGRVCVGGHDLDRDFRSLRLLTKSGMNLKKDDGIEVGEIWNLEYEDHAEPDPPHVEDVLVQGGKPIETVSAEKLRELIVSAESPWRGDPGSLFDGTVAATENGRVYVPDDCAPPARSTGYWLPGDDLIKHQAFGKDRFLYAGGSDLSAFTWAGMADPPSQISTGSLVRVSLARWHDPPSAPAGYYVQVSGVY